MKILTPWQKQEIKNKLNPQNAPIPTAPQITIADVAAEKGKWMEKILYMMARAIWSILESPLLKQLTERVIHQLGTSLVPCIHIKGSHV